MGVRWEGDWGGEVEEDQVFYEYRKRHGVSDEEKAQNGERIVGVPGVALHPYVSNDLFVRS